MTREFEVLFYCFTSNQEENWQVVREVKLFENLKLKRVEFKNEKPISFQFIIQYVCVFNIIYVFILLNIQIFSL